MGERVPLSPILRSSERPDNGLTQEPLDDIEPPSAQSLPPTDTGRDAWMFLAAATTVEILVWGLPSSVGILHQYWIEKLFAGNGESTVTIAATMQTGLLYMSGGLCGP